MIKQIPGKIYLSEGRGLTQTRQFRRYSTFNFGAYFHADKMPFDRLYVCNEETIAPGQHTKFEVEQASHVIIIPITGDVQYKYECGNSYQVQVEQIQLFTLPANSTFQVANPYPGETINLLQLWIKADEPVEQSSSQLFSFEFESLVNQLQEIIPGINQDEYSINLPFLLNLGCFSGRKDSTYSLQRRNTVFFAFVIEGAFELEGRLLHAGDAVALWNVTEVELEALSAQALILAIEIQP
ncbi:hypothetical protein GXP67_26415 [Rhodocytophaga rosea]|uniref:Quercetin 2,3-dioxygenase C-terminal cupin domain-containing protein n=1 Tax=Rhodocytophaga rosea TaxID=2704465 RepID=A0A6C0GPT6_9BACT|nr:hypothetical protein [Rhodocytophaga rosea]QHT69927.1 hypothetical protein GXP67_26415 [Rhodocytophaga rosea]